MKRWNYPYLILATRNENKRVQIADILKKELNIEVKSLNDFIDLPEIVEDKDSFEGNASKKAEVIKEKLEIPVIADDSGLVVPVLGGRPGIYSARYAREGATDKENNLKLLEEMACVEREHHEAYFVSVMALSIPNEEKTHIVRGELKGEILDELRGTGGFGYQPLFYLPEEKKTMAELTTERRNEIAHRALATRKLIRLLKERYQFE